MFFGSFTPNRFSICLQHILPIKERIKVNLGELITLVRHWAAPYSGDVQPYLRYFSVCSEVTANSGDGDDVRRRLQLLIILIVYWALLQLAFYLLLGCSGWAVLPDLLPTLLLDFVHLFSLHRHIYLMLSAILLYTAYLYWALYFREHCQLNDFLRRAMLTSKKFQSFTLVVLNAVRFGFVGAVDLFLVGLTVFGLSYQLPVVVITGTWQSTVASGGSLMISFLLAVLLFPLLYLVHLVALSIVLLAAGFITTFTGVLGIVSLAYIEAIFRRNLAQLNKPSFSFCWITTIASSSKLYSKSQPNRLNYLYLQLNLKSALATNLRHFAFFFRCDAFWAPVLTAYLALHLPASAYYLMALLFGREEVTGPAYLPILSLIVESALGCVGVHLFVARINGCLHRAGPLLMAFLARDCCCCCCNDQTSLPPRQKFRLSFLHASRLFVKKPYGLTYSGKCAEHCRVTIFTGGFCLFIILFRCRLTSVFEDVFKGLILS